MAKDNTKEIKSISEREVAKEMQDNKLSENEKQSFIASIMENYYLDNDNINFLVDSGYNFFEFKPQDPCFCLSGQEFQSCCSTKLKPKANNAYNSFEKSLLNPETYAEYLQTAATAYQKFYQMNAKRQVCVYPSCKQAAIENNLYNIDFTEEKYYSTNRLNVLDANFKMGENFFAPVTNNNYKFFGFCDEHVNLISKQSLSIKSSNAEISLIHLKAVQAKLFTIKTIHAVYCEDFIENYNSIEEKGFKAIFVFRMKKIMNQILSLQAVQKVYVKEISGGQNLKSIKWELSKQKNFLIQDLLWPQVCPSDFQVVNSVNNVFVNESIASIVVNQDDKKTFVTILFDRNNKKLVNFFKQYLLIIDENEKHKEYFVSNCALILSDNILFSSKYFEKLTTEDKVFLSAINKFRYENPTAGHEYVKMQFFAGFTKGNYFFK